MLLKGFLNSLGKCQCLMLIKGVLNSIGKGKWLFSLKTFFLPSVADIYFFFGCTFPCISLQEFSIPQLRSQQWLRKHRWNSGRFGQRDGRGAHGQLIGSGSIPVKGKMEREDSKPIAGERWKTWEPLQRDSEDSFLHASPPTQGLVLYISIVLQTINAESCRKTRVNCAFAPSWATLSSSGILIAGVFIKYII